MADLFNDTDSGAKFSPDRKYRYSLWRIWDKNKPLVMFIGLNPSKADEKDTDNTITRVLGFARDWGYGGFYMLNCFPYVSTNPEEMEQCSFMSLFINFMYLRICGLKCADVIFAWGAFNILKKTGQDKAVAAMFPNGKALIINKVMI